jgi:hypothetical protein
MAWGRTCEVEESKDLRGNLTMGREADFRLANRPRSGCTDEPVAEIVPNTQRQVLPSRELTVPASSRLQNVSKPRVVCVKSQQAAFLAICHKPLGGASGRSLAAQRRVGYLSLTRLCGSRYCGRAPSHVALGRTDNVLRKAISARRSASEPVAAEPVRLHRIRPRVKRFPATGAAGAAKHERWNLRDIVLVSSHAGLVLAADTNNL